MLGLKGLKYKNSQLRMVSSFHSVLQNLEINDFLWSFSCILFLHYDQSNIWVCYYIGGKQNECDPQKTIAILMLDFLAIYYLWTRTGFKMYLMKLAVKGFWVKGQTKSRLYCSQVMIFSNSLALFQFNLIFAAHCVSLTYLKAKIFGYQMNLCGINSFA